VTVRREEGSPVMRLTYYGADVSPDPIDLEEVVRYSTEFRAE
jgi:hypothetical protein